VIDLFAEMETGKRIHNNRIISFFMRKDLKNAPKVKLKSINKGIRQREY